MVREEPGHIIHRVLNTDPAVVAAIMCGQLSQADISSRTLRGVVGGNEPVLYTTLPMMCVLLILLRHIFLFVCVVVVPLKISFDITTPKKKNSIEGQSVNTRVSEHINSFFFVVE